MTPEQHARLELLRALEEEETQRTRDNLTAEERAELTALEAIEDAS